MNQTVTEDQQVECSEVEQADAVSAPIDETATNNPEDNLSTDIEPYEIPADLARVMNLRLSVLIRLERLEQTRQQMAKSGELSHRAELELGRQQREMQRLPNADIVTPALENLEKKLSEAQRIYELQQSGELDSEQAAKELSNDFDQEEPEETESPAAAEENEEENKAEPAIDSLDDFDFDDDDDLDDWDLDDDDSDDEDEVEDEDEAAKAALLAAAAAEPVDESYLNLLQRGVDQAHLLLKRDAITSILLEVAAAFGQDQRLYQLLDGHGGNPIRLFGWTAYGMAMKTVAQTTADKLTAIQNDAEADATESGELTPRDEQQLLTHLKSAVNREKKAIMREMAEDFWETYEQAAVILATENPDGDDRQCLRLFLRYALISDAPWLISSAAYDSMVDQISDTLDEYDPQPGATHILYADEYIDLACQGRLTPSLDQDMELNEKGSDRWRADKMWRKVVYGQATETAMMQTVEGLRLQQMKRDEKTNKIEEKLVKFKSRKDRANPKFAELQKKLQANNVMLARLSRAIEQVENKQIAELQHATDEAREKLETISELISPEVIARREAQGVRRLCKLCAKLKEPFLPLTLHENYKLSDGAINDRQTVMTELGEIEKLDPNVFREVLVPARKKEHRIMIRHSPYTVLVPGQGLMGMSWNPRGGTEYGRMVLPLFNMRPGMIQKLLHHLIADFRFDTSKESAGVDLLTSDTLVAAYATARWNYRKRSKDIREKAGFFNDENDRTNWRRHYQLYITSAMDGGKKLFFKCPEVYEAVLKYMGLPAGVERLS